MTRSKQLCQARKLRKAANTRKRVAKQQKKLSHNQRLRLRDPSLPQ